MEKIKMYISIKNVVHLLIFLTPTILYSQIDIKLPPMPDGDNETLLGIDTNKNFVRDDVERYIYENLEKRPQVFEAYLRLASSLTLKMINFNNPKLVNHYLKLIVQDGACLHSLEKKNVYPLRSTTLNRLINNTEARKKAFLKSERNIGASLNISKIPSDCRKQ